MKLAVIGAGYVGLVSAACFAEFGFSVTCIDKEVEKITALEAGKIPIYEPGLEQIVHSNFEAGRLTFSTDLQSAVANADVVFIAVGTPTRRGDFLPTTRWESLSRQRKAHQDRAPPYSPRQRDNPPESDYPGPNSPASHLP